MARDASRAHFRAKGVLSRESATICRQLAELDTEMARLAALRVQIVSMVEALPSAECPPPSPGTWCPPGKGGDPSCSS